MENMEIFEFGFTKVVSLALCEGRHAMPECVTGSVFPAELDPGDLDEMVRVCNRSLAGFPRNAKLHLYVTGLSSALGTVVRWAIETSTPLTLWHYNRETESYMPQTILTTQDARLMREGQWS